MRRIILYGSYGWYLEVDLATEVIFYDEAFQQQMAEAGWQFSHTNLETRRENYHNGTWGATFTDLGVPKGQVRVTIYQRPTD